MKSFIQKYKFIIILLMNYSILAIFTIGYAGGSPLVVTWLLPLLLVLTFINYIFSDKWWKTFILNGNLLISTITGILGNSYLYFKNICYDSEGVLVMYLELIIGIILCLVLSTVSVIVKVFSCKSKNLKNS